MLIPSPKTGCQENAFGELAKCREAPPRAPFQYRIGRLIVRSREISNPEIDNSHHCIALEFDSRLGSNAAEVPVKCERTFLNAYLVALILCVILQQYVLLDIQTYSVSLTQIMMQQHIMS